MLYRFLRVSPLAVLLTIAFGGLPAVAQGQTCDGGIGDLVWFDANSNGLRDSGEASLGINGVVLELRDSAGQVVATTTTSDGVGSIKGTYHFPFLCAGTYTVTIIGGVPVGYYPTTPGVGSDPSRDSSSSPVTVTLTNNPPGAPTTILKDVTIDFGFVSCAGSIGDFVWNDADRDGVQDDGEAGLSGVVVSLYLNDTQLATTTTDVNGAYRFGGVCPGTYNLRVTPPTGFTASPTGGTSDTALDSDASSVVVVLELNQTDTTIDFGFYSACRGMIGDFVWFDTNRDGVQGLGEPGIAGVTLQLLDGSSVVATAITDANGAYAFADVCAGSYDVHVLEGTLPGGVVPSPTAQGGDPLADSNGSLAPVTLATNSSVDLSIDFGYNTPPCSGSIGDFVWNDTNANGSQDAGEAGTANVDVTLRDADDQVVQFDTTDSNGYYEFVGVCAGAYTVEVNPATLPGGTAAWVTSPPNQGTNDAIDSDGVDHRAAVSLLTDYAPTNLTIDFGYFAAAPAIDIQKYTNGQDADTGTGPLVAVGSTVTWTYVVTNTGNVPLTGVTVTDDKIADSAISCASGSNVIPSLAVGADATCTATGPATAGQYANVGTATGSGGGTTVTDTDPSHYRGVLTTLNLTKLTGGAISATYNWTFELTGPGGTQRLVVSGSNNPTTFDNVNLVAGANYKICEIGIPAAWTSVWRIKRESDSLSTIPFLFGNTDAPIALPVGSPWHSYLFDPNYQPYPTDYSNDTRCVNFVPAVGQQTSLVVDNRYPTGESRTPGYWKNWNTCTAGNQAQTAANNGGPAAGYWLLDDVLRTTSITIGNLKLSSRDCVKAVRILDKSDVVTNVKRASEPLFNLAAHLLAARANVVAKAATCTAATNAINAAQTLLAKYKWNGTGAYSPTAGDANAARTHAPTLDAYNNNRLCTF